MTGQAGIYAEIVIDEGLNRIWHHKQEPHLHQRWDLRITKIEYLPKASPDEPQRFHYETRIGAIAGMGESMGDRTPERGDTTSSLKFASGYWKLGLCILGLFFLAAEALAQTPRVEVGVQLGTIDEKVLGEKPVVAGGRVTVHAVGPVDAEVEVNRFPVGGAAALFPATQALFGARIGRRVGGIGVYGKVRPGLTRFDVNAYVPSLGTRPTLDVGGVIEFYSRRHFAARLDFGDTVVFFGKSITIPSIAQPGPGVVPGTRHHLQASAGISLWF